jgi:O-antigen polysaccharide polymerase Wzy
MPSEYPPKIDHVESLPTQPVGHPTRNLRVDLPILLGRVIFGVASFSLFGIVQSWNGLGSPWGPAGSAEIAIVLFAVHVFLVRRRVGALDPAIWLPVCMLMFYFGIPISLEFIFKTPPVAGYDAWEIGASPNLARGYALALLTTVSFICGLYFAGFKDLSRGPEESAKVDRSLVVPAYIMTYGALVMIVFGIALVGPSVVFGIYGDWWIAKASGVDSRFIDMGIVFAGAGTFALLASSEPNRPVRRYFALAVVLVLSVINIEKGARAALVVIGLGAGWCYTQRVRRIGWGPVLIATFVMLIALPAMREWRKDRSLEESTQTSVRDLIGAAVYGMGETSNVYGYTMDLIPSRKKFDYGYSFASAALRAIPNFGLTPGKSWGEVSVEHHPANWITNELNPSWFAEGGGYGYAMGAEFYFNFGITGVLLGLIFWGYLTGRIRNAAGLSPMRLVASALFFANTSLFVRNILGAPLRAFLWPLLGLMILRAALSLLSTPDRRTVAAEGGEKAV